MQFVFGSHGTAISAAESEIRPVRTRLFNSDDFGNSGNFGNLVMQSF
jgi:hypothetical protein